MSLMNVKIRHDRIRVSVDTLTTMSVGGGPASTLHTSKLLVLPHAPIILAANGDQLLLNHAFHNLHVFGNDVGLREVADDLPKLLNTVVATPGYTFHPTAILVAGCYEGTMEAYVCRRMGNDSTFATQPIGEAVMPSFEWKSSPLDGDDDGSFIELARMQVRRTRRENPDVTIGGRLLLAEVTPVAVSVRTIADLEAG